MPTSIGMIAKSVGGDVMLWSGVSLVGGAGDGVDVVRLRVYVLLRHVENWIGPSVLRRAHFWHKMHVQSHFLKIRKQFSSDLQKSEINKRLRD